MGFHAFEQFKMTRAGFEKLQPHARTEMALLVQERIRQDGRGCLDADIAKWADFSHDYCLISDDIDAAVPEESQLAERIKGDIIGSGRRPITGANILIAIHDAPGRILRATRSDLATRFSVTPKGAEKAVIRLEEDGLIRRRGVVELTLTERGEQIVADMRGSVPA